MGKVRRVKGEFRKMAAQARERLKSGYWTNILNTKVAAITEAKTEGISPSSIEGFFQEKQAREINAYTNSVCNSEEVMYKKVCEILERDEDVINPINNLIDREMFDTLDSREQQRYIFMLMGKYSELKARYEAEKNKLS